MFGIFPGWLNVDFLLGIALSGLVIRYTTKMASGEPATWLTSVIGAIVAPTLMVLSTFLGFTLVFPLLASLGLFALAPLVVAALVAVVLAFVFSIVLRKVPNGSSVTFGEGIRVAIFTVIGLMILDYLSNFVRGLL